MGAQIRITMKEDGSYYLIIEAKKAQKHYFADLYRYKELLLFLAWRDVLVRYKQAFFGVAWGVFRPLLSIIAFTFIFGRIAGFPSNEVYYPLFVLAGMLPWLFISNNVLDTCQGLVNNAPLVSKVYFPRMIIPMAQVLMNLVDFFVSVILILIMGIVTHSFNWLTFLTLPLWITLMILLSTGVGLWLSSLTVLYRDIRLLVPFFVQFGMFISPIGYSFAIIPEKWQLLYSLNPLVGIINGFRWAFFGIVDPLFVPSVIIALFVTGALLISGFNFFRNMENTFADTI